MDAFRAAGQTLPTQSSVSDTPHVEVSIAACTDAGKKRHKNEDGFLVLDLHRHTAYDQPVETIITLESPGLLLAVADGMGGHRSGEVASRLCIQTLSSVLPSMLQREDSSSIEGGAALVQALETTNDVISNQAARNLELEGMGTTLTAALLRGTQLDVAQVGDSRAYLVRGGSLTQLTTDQTVANYMLSTQQGLPTDSRIGEMLVQAVGAQSNLDVVLTSSRLEPGDILLLCSDGLYKVVSPAEMLEIIGATTSLKTRSEHLVARANENGGPDNVTVVLAVFRARGAR